MKIKNDCEHDCDFPSECIHVAAAAKRETVTSIANSKHDLAAELSALERKWTMVNSSTKNEDMAGYNPWAGEVEGAANVLMDLGGNNMCCGGNEQGPWSFHVEMQAGTATFDEILGKTEDQAVEVIL